MPTIVYHTLPYSIIPHEYTARKGLVEQSHPYVFCLVEVTAHAILRAIGMPTAPMADLSNNIQSTKSRSVNTFLASPDARTGSIADDFAGQRPLLLQRSLRAAAFDICAKRSRYCRVMS